MSYITCLDMQLKMSVVMVPLSVCSSSSLTCFDVVVSVRPVEDRQLHQLHLFQIIFSLCLQIQGKKIFKCALHQTDSSGRTANHRPAERYNGRAISADSGPGWR